MYNQTSSNLSQNTLSNSITSQTVQSTSPLTKSNNSIVIEDVWLKLKIHFKKEEENAKHQKISLIKNL